jgi:molecular chaperone HscB
MWLWRKLSCLTIFFTGLHELKNIDFNCNYFELFGLPVSFKINLVLLESRYRELQFKFHPDRYTRSTPQEQNLAVQYVSLINQAYIELKSSLFRARYLLSLQDCNYLDDSNTLPDPVFLMEQIEFRDELADICQSTDSSVARGKLNQRVEKRYEQIKNKFQDYFNQGNLKVACETLAKLQFLDKFLTELKQLDEELENFN